MMLCSTRRLGSVVILVSLIGFLCSSTTGSFVQPILHMERIDTMTNLSISELLSLDRTRHAQIMQDGYIAGFQLNGSFNGFGFYWIPIAFGSPAKEFRLLPDTGSYLTWLKGWPTTDQSNTATVDMNYYDPNRSSTATLRTCHSKDHRCSYSQKYIGGSETSGYLVSDVLHLPTVNVNDSSVSSSLAVEVIFGLSNNLTEDLATQGRYDGILGLGHHPVSVISQLSKKGLVPKYFSHCLNGGFGGGGKLVLSEVLEPGMIYTPLILSNMGHYNVRLLGIDVAGNRLPVGSEVFSASAGTFVDSGTTFTYFPQAAYEALIDAIDAVVLPGSTIEKFMIREHQCYANLPFSGRSAFPPITLNFAGDASIVWEPEDYLFHPNSSEGVGELCNGFVRSHFKKDMIILGETFLKDKIASYILDRRLFGLVRYNCSSPLNIVIHSGEDQHKGVGRKSRCIIVAAIILHMIIYLV